MKQGKQCIRCGKEFFKPYGRGIENWTKQKYCGHECFHADRKHDTESKVCPVCKKMFTRDDIKMRSLSSWVTRTYCCSKCYSIGKKGRNNNLWGKTGNLSNRWKGGVTKPNEAARRSVAYYEWRNNVFKRDRYACRKCGSTKRKIRAHHIEPFHSHPDMRTKVENGITFCVDCHLTFHHIYGYKNSSQQLIIYLQE